MPRLRLGAFILAFTLISTTIALSFSAETASAAGLSQAPATCRLLLSSEQVALRPGAVFRRDFLINADACEFIAGPARQLIGIDLAEALAEQPGGRARIFQRFPRTIAGDPIVYERHSTWDCCGLETTYVDHQQTYSYDGTNSSVSAILTTAWWRTGTGWFKTAGPSQWFNTSNPATSVSTAGSASFNNTTFPCGCQPCDHTLNAEVRSYGNGSWTHSASWSGNLCSGWIHTSETWGTR